jgi:hypothetical protein
MVGHDEVDCGGTLLDPRKTVVVRAVGAIRAVAS